MILNSRAAQEKVVVKLVGDAKERIEGEKKKKKGLVHYCCELSGGLYQYLCSPIQ